MFTNFTGFRTYVVSFMVAAFGILEMTDWYSFLDNPGAGIVALGSALLMALLRTITTTPPGVPATPPKSDE